MSQKIHRLIKNFTIFNIFLVIVVFFSSIDTMMAQAPQQEGQNILPGLNIDLEEGAGFSQRVIQIILLMTVLSLAPSILVMMTAFTRVVVILSLLRTALGLQQTPPNSVIISLALFLTAFLMMPVFQQSYETGLKPLVQEEITLEQGIERASIPLKDFMIKHVRQDDIDLFYSLGDTNPPEDPTQVSLSNLIPAFMISELRRAFEIGFLFFVPFIIIDMVVASVLMAMGMMMLPPVIISLPFKLIFFVLIDGWHVVAKNILLSYG